MTAATEHQQAADPLDLLMPPPRPWWLKLAFALLIVAVVGFVGVLWRSGQIRPAPDCCGSGSGPTYMTLSDDGHAVTVAVGFFNSSSTDIIMAGAQVELEGAEVLSVGTLDSDGPDQFPIPEIDPFPAVAPAHDRGWIVATFIPRDCSAESSELGQSNWGKATVDLEAPDSWHPTFGRSYELPDPMVEADNGSLSVFAPPDREAAESMRQPLPAACALLGL